jgi:thiamine-monophosphate kinase
MKNEAEIIARVRELFPQRSASVGIGDDAAVVGQQVITTDLLIEDVDFMRTVPIDLIARKSLAVNLSDVAAMGAIPAYGVVALGLPPWALEQIDPFLRALAGAAHEYDFDLVGGDLSRADKLTIAITATGRIGHRPLLRSGARPGDRVYLSRPIGGSAAGLSLLQQFGWSVEPPRTLGYALRELATSAIRRHLDPEPELRLGAALGGLDEVTACIDVSDGLSTDLHHLCDASGCGAEIERQRIPVFPDLVASGSALGIDVQNAVLHGGEEYALLFTSSLRESDLSSRLRRPVYAIGRITERREVTLDGMPFPARGFDHFQASDR